MICVNSKIFRYNIKKVIKNVTGGSMFLKKQKKKQQEVTIEENTQIFIEDFKKLVDEGKKESVRSVIKFMANSIQSELLTKCMYNDRNYPEIDYMRAILNSFLLDLSFDFWQKCNIRLKVQNTPIISCVWNHSRMIDGLIGLGEINKNPFNGISFAYNIQAVLIEPLGLVVVDNGNHSVNAAIVYDEGEIIVNTVITESISEKFLAANNLPSMKVVYYHDFNFYAMQMHLADISSDAEIFKIFPELKEVSAEKNKTICFYAEESKIEKIMKQFLPKEQEITWPKENTNEMKVIPRV